MIKKSNSDRNSNSAQTRAKTRFLEIPAISILNGQIVVVKDNKYETLTIDNKLPDTLDLLELITENYEIIYLMDIDGLTKGKPQLVLHKKIMDFCTVWVDAGVNDAESVYDLLVAGADEVVISSKTLDSLLELAKAFELTENIIFELDYSDGVISPNNQIRSMTPKEIGYELLDLGVSRLIFADIERIESGKPLERNLITSLVGQGLELYVGGGIKLDDVFMLKKLKTRGALIELTNILMHGKVDF